MPLSTFKQKQVQEMKDKAVRLYQQGLDTRTVAKMLKELHGFKRSHTWVWAVSYTHLTLPTKRIV